MTEWEVEDFVLSMFFIIYFTINKTSIGPPVATPTIFVSGQQYYTTIHVSKL